MQLSVLLITLVISALWAGGTRPEPLYLGTSLMALSALWVHYRSPKIDSSRLAILAGVATVCVVWLCLLVAPIPSGLVSLIGGERAALYSEVGALHTTARTIDPNWPSAPLLSLALNRAGAMRVLLLLVGAFSAVYLSATMPRRQREWLIGLLVVSGAGIAISGLCETRWPQCRQIWWMLTPMPENGVACFANANHYGGFLALLCPATLALCVREIKHREWERLVGWGMVMMILIAGVMASKSRGAYIIIGFAMVVTTGLSVRRGAVGPSVAMSLLACAGLLMVALFSTRAMDIELQTFRETGLTGRTDVWAQSLRVWQHFPLIGLGPEGFRVISTQYLAETNAESMYAHHAESTYLQLLADGGIVGVALALGLIWAYSRCVISAIRKRRLTNSDRLAGGGAVLIALLHGLFDFPFHVPVYGWTVSIMLGLLLVARTHTDGPIHSRRLRLPWGGVACAAVIIVGVIMLTSRNLIYQRDKFQHVRKASITELVNTLSWAPTYWAAWYFLGRAFAHEPSLDNYQLAERCLDRAATLHPTSNSVRTVRQAIQQCVEQELAKRRRLEAYLNAQRAFEKRANTDRSPAPK